MPLLLTRPELLYAWRGPSLLVVNNRGECGDDVGLSGFYFRETRYLHTFRLEIGGERPWLCERGDRAPESLAFVYIWPERTRFGGGGSDQGDDTDPTNARGIGYRSFDIRADYEVRWNSLHVILMVTNRARRRAEVDLAWVIAADYADLQEAQDGQRRQDAAVVAHRGESARHESARHESAPQECVLRLRYQHPVLPYETVLRTTGPGAWRTTPERLATCVGLEPQETARVTLAIEARDVEPTPNADEACARVRRWREWRDSLVRVAVPANRSVEMAIASNIRSLASLPLLEGSRDEWLAFQAGIPLYPALFGRDALTAGWQGAMIDRGDALDAVLTRLGRLQGARVDPARDEEPGRIVQQVRTGPLARLGTNPFARYYGDFASPLMYVIALAHLYAWTGDTQRVARHWDSARRILDWARDFGDADGDGYLEYQTLAPAGPKNQGWKDSGDAVLYADGSPVPAPIGTCELQGYWFAAQQLMAALSWAMGARADARAHWDSAMELKARFNRDWWLEHEGCIALAMDPDKRLVRAITSNVGHCVAAGIVSDPHVPRVVGRLFAPDMFTGWGIRTLSTQDVAYNPLSYHRGSVWAVENATITFGLRRYGFDTRALELTQALFELAELYPDYNIPECVGGYARGERPFPGAYPRANTPQLWNASSFPLLVHTLLGLQPVAPLDLLVIDPVLPTWLPEVILHDVRVAGATATLRFWRDTAGHSHGEVVRRRGTLHVLRQPPLESLSAGVGDRFRALLDSVFHH